MTYFSKFNQIQYDFTVPSDLSPIVTTITDIDRRVNINISAAQLNTMCNTFIVPSGKRPEQIAEELYNDPGLHWTIFFINGLNDLASGWPMNERDMYAFIIKKYGTGNEYNTHHFEKMPEGVWMDQQFVTDMYGETALLVTNYDYENDVNDRKRIIKVIKPEFIAAFVLTYLGT